MLDFLDPTVGGDLIVDESMAPRSEDLNGKVIALIDNGKTNANVILDHLASALTEIYGLRGVVRIKKPCVGNPLTPEEIDEVLAANAAIAIAGVGDCGSCSAATVADGILLERSGIPAVSINTDQFRASSEAMASSFGFDGYEFVLMPHPIASLNSDEIDEQVARLIPRVAEIVAKNVKTDLAMAGARS